MLKHGICCVHQLAAGAVELNDSTTERWPDLTCPARWTMPALPFNTTASDSLAPHSILEISILPAAAIAGLRGFTS
jgi:hypothetical protein